MKSHLKIACLSALGLCFVSFAAAQPLNGPAIASAIAPASIIAVGCESDCWHDRWRSHHRWGSYHQEHWHDRWRSHFRWGSYGGYGHSRWGSHYRWGSYHRY
jgi:hypothetical protein